MRRIVFLTGYYGSGKSELAVNLAVKNRADYLVDLDIINPYFRSREMEDLLRKQGTITISSDLEKGRYADQPYISRRIFEPFLKPEATAIYDLGGNDLGAKLLKQFKNESEPFDLFLVTNIYRMDTDSAEKIVRLVGDIENSGGFKVTGIVNNTNLLRETSLDDIRKGQAILMSAAKHLRIPIVYTCIPEWLDAGANVFEGETIRLKLYLRKSWY